MSVERSSFYNSFGGKTTNKFETGQRKSSQIAEHNFFKWTNNNMYRTSYNDMSKKVRKSPQKLIICYRENQRQEKIW
jgi:hypothetical protein